MTNEQLVIRVKGGDNTAGNQWRAGRGAHCIRCVRTGQ